MEWISASINLLALAGILVFSIKYLIQAKINSYFSTQLKTYEQKLAVITKNAEYDLSKKLFDFEAYASKKHTVYPELYGQAFELWDEISHFDRRFDEDAIRVLNKMDMDVLNPLFNKEIKPTAEKLNKTYAYFYKNELYLSKDVTVANNEALVALRECVREIAMSFFESASEIADQRKVNQYKPLIRINEEYRYDAEQKIRILKETIYKELSYTHFEEMEKNEEALS